MDTSETVEGRVEFKDSGDKFERKPQGRQMGSKIQTQTLSFEGTLSGQCSCQYVSPQRPEI